MSTLSSSAADTRRKQSKRDEVSPLLPPCLSIGCAVRQARVEAAGLRRHEAPTERGLHVFAVHCPQNAYRVYRPQILFLKATRDGHAAFHSAARTLHAD